MNNNLINILLRAEIDPKAVSNIYKQIEDISNNSKPIKINIDIDKSALQAIENINKKIAGGGASLTPKIDTSQLEKGLARVTDHYTKGEEAVKRQTKTTIAGYEKTVELLDLINKKSIKKDVTYDFEKERKNAIEMEKIQHRAWKMNEEFDKKKMDNLHAEAIKIDKIIEKRKQEVVKMEKLHTIALKMNEKFDTDKINKAHAEALKINKAMDSETNRIARLGENKGSIVGINFKDNDAIKQYVLSLQEAGAEITRFSRGVTSAGQEQVSMTVRTQTANNMVKEQKLVVDQNTQALYKQSEALKPNVNRMLGWAESMKVAITKSAQWAISMSLLYGNLRKLKDGIQYIKDLEHQTQQIQMVTKMTTAEVNELVKSYSALAQELSTTTLKTTEAAMGFFRQGLNKSEVEDRLRASIQLSAVLGQSLETTAEQITAGVNSLGVDAERLGDVVTRVGAVAGTSGQELLKIIQLAGSTAKQGGMTLEELASMGAIISESTRLSAETIGASLNTIIAKFQQVDSLTGEVNEDYGKIIQAMESIGVSTVDKTTGQLRNINDILVELGQKWDTLDKKTQNYITTTIGVRQFNRFASLLGNIGRQQELLIEGQNSQNEMTEQYAVYLTKVESAAERTKNAMQVMWQNTINPQFLRQFYDMNTTIIQFIDKVGLLKVAVFTLSTIILLGTKAWREYATSMTITGLATTIITKMQFLGQVLTAVYGGAITAKMGFTMLAGTFDLVKIKMAAVTLGLSLLVTGTITYISKLINAQAELKRTNEELVQSYKNNVTGNNENIKRLKDLSSEYDKIKDKINNQISLNEEEKVTLDELIKINPSLVQGYNERGEAIIDTTQNIKDMIEELERANEIEDIKLAQGGEDFFKEAIKDAKKYSSELDDVNFKISNILNGVDINNSGRDSRGGGLVIPSLNVLKEQYNALSEEEKKLASGMELRNKIQDTELKLRDLQNEVKIYETNLKSSQAEVHNSLFAQTRLNDSYKSLSSSTKSLVADYIKMMNVMDYKDFIDMQVAVGSFTDALSSPVFSVLANEYQKLIAEFKSGSIDAKTFDKEVNQIITTLKEIGVIPEDLLTKFFKDSSAIEQTNKSIQDTSDSIQSLYKEVSTAVDEYDLFTQALKELNEEGQVSKSTLDKLIEIYPNIIQLTGLQKDKMIELMNTSKDKRRQMIDDEIAATKANSEATVQQIMNVKSYAEALTELAKMKAGMAAFDAGASTGDDTLDAKLRADYDRAKEVLAIIEDANKKVQALEGMRTMFDSVDYKYKEKPKKDKKDNRQFLEVIDAEIRAIKLKNDSLLKTEKLLQEQLKLAKDIEGVEGLNEQYRIAGEIIEHNKTMLESFKKEQDLVHVRANEIRKQNSKYDTEKWFDSNAEATVSYINLYNKATKSQQEEMSKLFNQIQALKKAWMESATEVEKMVDANKELVLQQDKLLDQQYELERQEWIKKGNIALKERRDRLQALTTIEEAIVQIIRKRGEEEKRQLDENHKSEMDSLEKRHQERKKKYAEELDEFKKMIQAKIDALEPQWEEEDYLEQLNKEREEANRLQKEIDVLSLDDSLTARNKTIELRKQLADQNEKIAKMQQKKERDTLKKSLQDQLKNREQDAKDKEIIADKTYENDKKRLEEDYRINKEFLDRKYSDEQVYAEARESIMRGTVEVAEGMFVDIYDAYQDFEDKFGRGMGILGDIIKKDFLDQLKKAQQAVEELKKVGYLERPRDDYDSDYRPRDDEWDYRDPRGDRDSGRGGSGGKHPEFERWSDSDYEQYIQNGKDWERSSNEYEKNTLRIKNSLLRAKYWGNDRMHENKYHWRELENWRYKKGGETEETGLHILDGVKGKPERVLSAQQTSDFNKLVYDDMPKLQNILKSFEGINFQDVIKSAISSRVNIPTPNLSNVVQRQGAVYHIDKIFDISGTVTKDTMPLIRKEANGIEETLKNLNKGGVFRPVKI